MYPIRLPPFIWDEYNVLRQPINAEAVGSDPTDMKARADRMPIFIQPRQLGCRMAEDTAGLVLRSIQRARRQRGRDQVPARCPVVWLYILPHPTSRDHELACFDGKHVVVPRGQFRTGELAAFLPEGSALPDELLRRLGRWDRLTGYGTLRGPERNRVRMERIKGVVSHGLLVPSYGREHWPGDVFRTVPSVANPMAFNLYEFDCAANPLGVTPPPAN